MDFYINAIKKISKKISEILFRRQKVNIQTLSLFTRHFATMYKSGVGIVQIFDILSEQATNKKFKRVLSQVRRTIAVEGETVSHALSRYPDVFSPVYASLVKVGEKSGGRAFVLMLEQLTESLEKEYALREKIHSVLVYPVAVLVMSVIVLVLSSIFIFPVFVPLLDKVEGEKPLPTVLLLGFIKIFRNIWFVIIFFVILYAIIQLFSHFIKTPEGRKIYEKMIFHLPIISKIEMRLNSILFCRTISVLHRSGISMIDALAVTKSVMTLDVYRDYIDDAIKTLKEEGESLSKYFYMHPLFPRALVHIMAVGEESGELALMLEKMANFYDMELDSFLQSATNMFEPILMMFLGMAVLFILLAVFTPLYKMMEF